MNFTKSLLDLYEANKEIVGIEKYSGKKKTVLLPLYHDSLRVGYEAVLTADGDLVEIRTVPDKDKDTLLPVYQPSRSRELLLWRFAIRSIISVIKANIMTGIWKS